MLLITCGFTKPVATLARCDVPSLIESVALHTTILAIKAELEQMILGLEDPFKTLFVHESQELSAGTRPFKLIHVEFSYDSFFIVELMKMFEMKTFSEPGSSEFTKEQTTYIFFRDLLEEMESKHGTLTHNMALT